jgi:tetratricopeptide (TPR) repeat protein
MTQSVKLGLYMVLLIGALCCGYRFSRGFAQVTAPGNAPTNQAPAAAPANESKTATEPNGLKEDQRKMRMMSYGAGLLFFTLGLGLLIAYDLSHYVGRRVEEFIWEGEGEGFHTPEYDHAENVWANGQHLEAVELMREYLKTHPREQYVAIRIAEIYEKDLGNYVAAALEYEEILKKPLPPEKWGWCAVHLANLYSGKLNRSADAEGLLRRIVAEYPETAAATKARRRLGDQSPNVPEIATSQEITEENVVRQPANHLPPGFRPKG